MMTKTMGIINDDDQNHGIINADYADVDIPPATVNLIVTSPPYPGLRQCAMSHTAWLQWFTPLLSKMHRELSANGVLALNIGAGRVGGAISAEFWSSLVGLFAEWHWIDTYVWNKLNPVPSGAQRGGGRRYDLQAWEPVYTLAKSSAYTYNAHYAPYQPKTRQKGQDGAMRAPGVAGHYGGGHGRLSQNGAYQSNVLTISPSGGKFQRPRAAGQSFPVELAWRLIQTYSNPGDLVFDPFAGVATSCYVARLLRRRWLGVEILSDVCDVARAWVDSCSDSQKTS